MSRVEDTVSLASGSSTRSTFLVKGMDCADEVRLIEDRIGRLRGVTGLQFDLMQHRLLVQGSVTPSEIQLAIRQLGMSATPEGTKPEIPSFWELRGRLVTVAVAGIALGVALLMDVVGVGRVYVMTLLAISSIAGGWHVAPRGVRAARNRALDMNFLMTIAAVGAWIIGEQAEAASTLFLFAVAELLESYSMDRARNAIRRLMELSPAEATVRRDGTDARVPVSEIDVGETVIVRPGEKIAVDGLVAAGQSSVNQAAITGEAMPVDVAVGDSVFAGTINVQGALEVRSEKPASDTTLARIIHAVEEAQATRAPSQTFVDRFARIYTPGVVIAAIVIAILPPLAGFGSFEMWVYRALTMLVVACPCALVISTPVTIVSGLARAARGGVLIKGGAYLEAAGAITTICFDKTGTLTRGEPWSPTLLRSVGCRKRMCSRLQRRSSATRSIRLRGQSSRQRRSATSRFRNPRTSLRFRAGGARAREWGDSDAGERAPREGDRRIATGGNGPSQSLRGSREDRRTGYPRRRDHRGNRHRGSDEAQRPRRSPRASGRGNIPPAYAHRRQRGYGEGDRARAQPRFVLRGAAT